MAAGAILDYPRTKEFPIWIATAGLCGFGWFAS